MHPPTPPSFVRNFIIILEIMGFSAAALEIKESAGFFTELSVCDYYFTTRKASSTALGAVLIAVDDMSETILPLGSRHIFFQQVQIISRIDPFSVEVQECKKRLRLILDMLNISIEKII